jgi:hypothetical protein
LLLHAAAAVTGSASDGRLRREELIISRCRESHASAPTCAARWRCSRTPRGGCPEKLLLAHGFTITILADLVRDGLATIGLKTVSTGGQTSEVVHIRITGGGRRALACPGAPNDNQFRAATGTA